MTNDDSIEAYAKEAQDLETQWENATEFHKQLALERKLIPAGYFFRKLALKYREVLQIIESRDDAYRPGDSYEGLAKGVLALTKKDIEDLE